MSSPADTAQPAPLSGDSWRLDEFDIDAYLRAVGLEREAPTVDLLERLHEAHVRTFPFGNVDVLLAPHPGVAPVTVQAQLVSRRRGGYCFEHGQMFAAAAHDLGFGIRRFLGRVGSPHGPRTHMTVAVRAEGEWWLADPGFGYSTRGPIALRHGATRDDGGRMFALTEETVDDVTRWTLSREGVAQHYVETLPVQPVDVHTGHMITSLGLASGRFTRNLIVARHLPEGHVTVTQSTRTVRPDHAPTVHEPLTPDEAADQVRALGIELDPDEQQRLRSLLHELPPLDP